VGDVEGVESVENLGGADANGEETLGEEIKEEGREGRPIVEATQATQATQAAEATVEATAKARVEARMTLMKEQRLVREWGPV
tara:strand:- start:133 stop:381 length:249 start_codon:yes stop_codon:yes gene_type:complete